MIQFCTGIPGAGKSYYGVFYIGINFFSDDLRNKYKKFALSKTKYKVCLTNINELKFESFNDVYPFDFKEFKIIIDKLYNLYKLGKNDTELLEYVKDENFSNILIVFDECQKDLNEEDEAILWWLSYHRHFYQDIILITQDISLVATKYKSFTEFFYKAIPSSRKLFSNKMIYQKYIGYQLYKTQQADTKKLPIVKDLFNHYGSGENNTQKSLVRYYLLVALGIFTLLIIGAYAFISSKSVDTPKEEIKEQSKPNLNNTYIQTPVTQYQKDFIDSTYYEMVCNKNLCFINGYIFEKTHLFHILNHEYDTKFLKIINSKYLIKTTDKFNLFKKKGTENEKNDLLGSFTPTFTKSE